MKAFIKSGIIIVCLSLLGACQAKENASLVDLGAKEFSEKLKAEKDSALLVDVRTPEEFASGHLAGALSIDFNGPGFAESVAKLPKDKHVYLYCRSGRRSKAAMPIFLKAGYKSVFNLTPGILGWESAGLPVTGNQKSE